MNPSLEPVSDHLQPSCEISYLPVPAAFSDSSERRNDGAEGNVDTLCSEFTALEKKY